MMRLVRISVGSEGIVFLFRIASSPFLRLSLSILNANYQLLTALHRVL
jgi:hypothetical protein